MAVGSLPLAYADDVKPTAASPRDSTFQQAIFFRTADPTDPIKGAKCQQ